MMYNYRKTRKDTTSNENANQMALEEDPTNIYEQTDDQHVIYADVVRNTDKVDESSFSSNQHQPDVIYSEFAPTQPEAIYANDTAL